MLFKSKKDKELEAKKISDSHVQEEVKFNAAIKAAGEITDPAERVLQLDKIKGDIRSRILNEKMQIIREAEDKGDKARFATQGSGLAVGLTGAALLAGPLGWIGVGVVGGGMVAGRIIESKRKKSVTKKLSAELDKHISTMSGQSKRVDGLIDATLENNVKEISQSPLFDKVRALPDIAQKFSDVAAKRIREEVVVPPAVGPEAEAPATVKKPAKKKPKNPYDLTKKII